MGTTHSWPALFWHYKLKVKIKQKVKTIRITVGLYESSPQARTGFGHQRLAKMLLFSHSSLHHYDVILPFSPTFFRAVWFSWNCLSLIHPHIHTSIHSSTHPFKSSVSVHKVSLRFHDFCSLQQCHSSSVKQGTSTSPSPQGLLKGHRQCIWRSGAPGCFLVFDPWPLTLAHGCKGYLTFCNSSLSQEGRGCPRRCSSFDSSTLCSL